MISAGLFFMFLTILFLVIFLVTSWLAKRSKKKTYETGLVAHARRELELLGEDKETIDWYISVVRAFTELGHSGGSAEITTHVLNQLLQYKNLTDLTDDPNEWYYHGPDVWPDQGVWQNMRNGEAFSHDGGKTYYLLSEGAHDGNRQPMHQSLFVKES